MGRVNNNLDYGHVEHWACQVYCGLSSSLWYVKFIEGLTAQWDRILCNWFIRVSEQPQPLMSA